MPAQPGQVSLRVRLPSASWRRFRVRADARCTSAGIYADMVFRYLLYERLSRLEAGSAADTETIYVDLEVPSATKSRVAAWSESEQINLASFSGILLDQFLSRFGRDPRDLALIHDLTSRLEQSPVLSQADLRKALKQYERNSDIRLPAGYLAGWIHGRLKPLVRTVEHEGASVAVTVGMLEEMLAIRAQKSSED